MTSEYFAAMLLTGFLTVLDMVSLKETLKSAPTEWTRKFIESEGVFALFSFLEINTKDQQYISLLPSLLCSLLTMVLQGCLWLRIVLNVLRRYARTRYLGIEYFRCI